MFAVGHLALGYISGKATSRPLRADVNIPLLFFVSILPDADLLVPGLHRGPTHSLMVFALIFLPFLALYKKRAVAYFVAVFQHVLVGDFLTAGSVGGIQLFWPLTPNYYGAGIHVTSLANVYLEWTVFLLCMVWMFKAKDVQRLLSRHPSNMFLIVPAVAVFLPVFLSIPLNVPLGLLLPHVILLILFSLSILVDLKPILKNLLKNVPLRV